MVSYWETLPAIAKIYRFWGVTQVWKSILGEHGPGCDRDGTTTADYLSRPGSGRQYWCRLPNDPQTLATLFVASWPLRWPLRAPMLPTYWPPTCWWLCA